MLTTCTHRSGEDGETRELAEELVALLGRVGVQECYGICGREIVPIWSALIASLGTAMPIATRHARHENGAGFAAIGSWMQSDRPVALYTTTGPGITNVLTSLEAARASGAKLVLLSPLTPAVERGRLGIQETGLSGWFNADLYREGRLFDSVTVLESVEQLPTLAGQLAAGFAGPGPHLAHIAVPTTLQTQPVTGSCPVPQVRRPALAASAETLDEVARLLEEAPFAVWVGWGARRHAAAIRELLDRTGAPVISSPRGLGIADTHPQFLGVTGNGGREPLATDLALRRPHRMLVLGTALAEATSGWNPELVPPGGLIHVDTNARVFARAYPTAETFGIQADIGELLAGLNPRLAQFARRDHGPVAGEPGWARDAITPGMVHPRALMEAIQRVVVDGEDRDIPVLADASSAMFWGARHLRFATPGRWLIEGHWGSMGFAGAAVVGAASARGAVAMAICGDASLHMTDELSTAVRYGIPAVWVVLNDAGLGIVRNGMKANGRLIHDADYPPADFAAVARAKGAQAIRVEDEGDLDAALLRALEAGGPFVVDVAIDPEAVGPMGARTRR
jgi:acetolactate synthase I/II/III large subunit